MSPIESDSHPSIAPALPPFGEVNFLVLKFPRLFRGRAPEFSYVSKGWLPLMTRLLEDIDRLLDDQQAARFRVEQIERKLGSLRIYWRLGSEATFVRYVIGEPDQEIESGPSSPSPLFLQLRERITAAQNESAVTCEGCSRPAAVALHDRELYAMCEACALRHGDRLP